MKSNRMRIYCAAAVAIFIALQLVRPSIPSKPASAEIDVPPEIKAILQKGCYSCHSDEVRLSWLDEPAPAYWLVRHDILAARARLNFSTLGASPVAAQRARLFEAVNMIQLGAMPLGSYSEVHPEARLSAEDLATLKAYLNPWPEETASGGQKPPPTSATSPAAPIAAGNFAPLNTVQPESNGLPFDPAFRGWKLISTTDRGDNNTLRFILGNDIAIDAIRQGKITPWPDGARLAKIAWKKTMGADGLVHPGDFVQVELMVKDASSYRSTDGWGWGRWVGRDFKPYGGGPQFVNECTGCHLPVRGNDYVYTLPMTAASVTGDEIVNTRAAALPAVLPVQPFTLNAITLVVDEKRRTTSTLFGNDQADAAARAWLSPTQKLLAAVDYPQGAELVLVTWAQRDDPHWFGARIPDEPLTVEVVRVPSSRATPGYQLYAGGGLQLQPANGTHDDMRTRIILSLTPAPLPPLSR